MGDDLPSWPFEVNITEMQIHLDRIGTGFVFHDSTYFKGCRALFRCGNPASHHMLEMRFEDIILLDGCPVCIREREKNRKAAMKWFSK